MFSLSIFNKSYFALAILVSLLSTICLSCHSNNKLPELIIKDDFSGKIDLGQVDIIGPFYFDKNKTDEYKSIDQDDLSYFGLKENELDEKKIENINYTSAKNTSFLSPGFENKILDIPAEYIDFWNLTDTNKTAKKMSNYYLACNIVSGKERNVLFLASACFGIKVWLNNRFIQEESYHTGYPKGFDYYIKLPLRKGKNLFVLKTNRGADQYCWRLSSKIADLASSQKEYSIDYFQHFIMNPIVYGKQVLKIYVGQYLSGNSITVCIKDRDNHVIKDSLRQLVDFNGNSFLNLEKLPDGLYTCTLKLPFGSFDEVFYNGDFRHLEDGINRKIASLKNLKVEDAKSLEAANNKMDTLFSQSVKSRSEGDIKFNEKNVVLLALSIQHILDRLPDHSLNLYDRSDGTYFKAYKSNLDDTYQYYMFHASKKVASDKELPVVFVMPYFQNPIDPAMNSWYYNNTDQLEWEKRLADSAGFALVWPYLRGNSATSAIGVADFFEVFNDVKKKPQT